MEAVHLGSGIPSEVSVWPDGPSVLANPAGLFRHTSGTIGIIVSLIVLKLKVSMPVEPAGWDTFWMFRTFLPQHFLTSRIVGAPLPPNQKLIF